MLTENVDDPQAIADAVVKLYQYVQAWKNSSELGGRVSRISMNKKVL